MALMIKGLHIEEIIIDTGDKEEEIEPVQEEPKEPEPAKSEPKKTTSKVIDKGKVGALHKAGWNVAKIADEMKCSQPTIRKILKEMGL